MLLLSDENAEVSPLDMSNDWKQRVEWLTSVTKQLTD